MKIVIGITGSSGAVYALDFLKQSTAEKYLIISKWGKALMKDELDLTEKELQPYVKRQFSNDDLTAPIASGSNHIDACVILPCSTSTLGKIASGIGDTLITRAAQVAMKERFKLILCIRETPLSTVSLEQCARLSQYGAVIMPISSPLYFVPKTVDEYVSAFTDKLLGVLGNGNRKAGELKNWNRRMRFTALREFVNYLEKNGELHRVSVEVDPILEITEIATRALREKKPALLFEKVKGAKYPLVINTLASERRIELGLGEEPDRLGKQLVAFFEEALPPSPKMLVKHPAMVRRFFSSRTSDIMIAPSQEIVGKPNLDDLPIIQCWPQDGGRFITLPQVFTHDPRNGKRNVGMYRMHVFDAKTTGMHWQIQKGGGFHYYQADKINKPLELAVALGTDPAMLLATIAPLPEGIDEVMFAGFLRKKSTQLVGGRSISISVPANAEFILEGFVPPMERRSEGPFGDHFGHYSAAAEFPVFHITALTRRKDPIYPAAVVGIPPMEDKFLGDATQKILAPLAKLLHSEINGMWAYYEAGFHNLLVVSIEERYQKEAMKTALGLMGTQQLSLTKCLIAVSEDVDPRNFREVLHAVRDNFDPHYDFILLPKVPLDTLDFTSYTMNLGSKMILDATRKKMPKSKVHVSKKTEIFINQLAAHDRRIIAANLIADTLLLVKVKHDGAAVVKKLLKSAMLDGIKLVAAVSEDVDIHNQESYIWGVFTRFDCERDVIFTQQKLVGISPIYKGTLGIDATWKDGYPEPLVMDEKIVKLVDKRWDSYWK